MFPNDMVARGLAKKVDYVCDFVYDFVLSSEHAILVNGTLCVTLGHDYQEDVVKHE